MVYTHGRGNWIIALDQATGAVVWEKQINGYGNMEKVAVTYHDGVLHVGTHDGDRGAALALNADNGDLLWHFWGAPGPGELGNDTWEGDVLADRRRDAVDAPGARSRPRPGLLDVRQRPRQPVLPGRFRSAAA